MEAPAMMVFFLLCWIGDLLVAVPAARRRQGPIPLLILPRIPLVLVAVTMIRIFIIGGASTIAQLGAGTLKLMDLWSDWSQLWPIYLLITAAAAAVYLTATIVCLCRQDWRRNVWPNLTGLVSSGTAFFAVGMNFPSA
ncbi:MAG: hypothetical protein AB7U73_23595 [Pirellulales bacterium]